MLVPKERDNVSLIGAYGSMKLNHRDKSLNHRDNVSLIGAYDVNSFFFFSFLKGKFGKDTFFEENFYCF